jgi:type I restriction enzyme S subunit
MENKNSQIRQFPIGWEVKKLKDVCTNSGEYGANAPALPYTEGSIRYIRITDIDDHGQLVSDDKVSLDETVAQNYLLSHDDILFARTGDTVGKSLLYKTEMGKAAYAGYLIKFSFDKKQIIPDYFNAIAKSEIFDAFIVSMKRIGAKPNINSREYGIFKFPLPKDLQMQSAIANILSKVDDAIASVQNSIAAAERLKKSLMQNLLTGRMKPDGICRTSEEFYNDDKFGKVPVGWEVKRVKEICLNTGDYGANASATVFDKTKPRFIRITDIDDFGQLLDEGKVGIASDNYSKYLLDEDDFLFARTGDTVGKSLLYKKEMGSAVYAGYLIKFTFDKGKMLPEYFNLIAKSDFFEAFKIAMKRVGAKPNINSREYCSFRFILPSKIEEQKVISCKFANIDKVQKKMQQKKVTLERLKKSLMQNLLTGRVSMARS